MPQTHITMKVFKFGGASVRNGKAVKNLFAILQAEADKPLIVIVSAMGKTTNALETLLADKISGSNNVRKQIETIASNHKKITTDLFPVSHPAHKEVSTILSNLETIALEEVKFSYDREYDRLVCFGEHLSSTIIHHYLLYSGLDNVLVDAQKLIKTDSRYRHAQVDMEQAGFLIRSLVNSTPSGRLIISQGFIGSDDHGYPTTLGREGSDYTAAIFAHALNASEVVTWKDVEGIYNADPNVFPEASPIPHVSFRETIELAYYGAKIIHPKTIKPLQNKNIPLKVKSFINPEATGSIINRDTTNDGQSGSYIVKPRQVLISLLSKDYDFINESRLSWLIAKFAAYGIKVNLMQNSAITFTACVDHNEEKIATLILELEDSFFIRYNEGVHLLTIRHYSEDLMQKLTCGKSVLAEQRNRTTVQYVLK